MALPRFRITERQVMMGLLLASFIGFAGALIFTSFRQPGERLEPTDQARVHFMRPSETPGVAQYLLADYFDPSLMSLPNAHGFSQNMWQHSAAAPARTFEPTPDFALLDPPPGAEMPVLLAQTPPAETVQGDVRKLPAITEDPVPPSPVTSVTTQSTLRVEGALASRAPVEQADLPAIESETGLRPTRVRVAAAPDGRVRYVALDRSSGNDAADAQALGFARLLQFEPTSSTDPLALTWGVVKFYWATK
jgi:hypothetical protein